MLALPVSVWGDVDDPAGPEPGPCGGETGVEEVGQEEVAQIIDSKVKLEENIKSVRLLHSHLVIGKLQHI